MWEDSDQPGQGIGHSRDGRPLVICPHVHNSPFVYNDPSGHCPWCILLAGAVIGAVAGGIVAAITQAASNQPVTLAGVAAGAAAGALIGSGAVLFAPAAVAVAGDLLAGAGLATGSTALFGAGMAAYGASTAMENAIAGTSSYPTFVVDSNSTPNIANNIKNAQANGAPSVLTSTTDSDLIAANRRAATAGFTGPQSPDEYPFASTYEGGAGAYVSSVPIQEQRIQGGSLGTFYRHAHSDEIGHRIRLMAAS